jgi:uncharacterized protein
MALETGQQAIQATIRSACAHGYQQVKLKYAGGEPLLQAARLFALHRYAQQHTARHGIALEGVVLSNGTLLTSEIISEIAALKLHLVISLDSLAHPHHSQRCYASGRDSAPDAVQAIEQALTHGVVPAISITVSGRNAATLPDLVAWVLERTLPFRLNLYREPAHTAAPHDLRLEEQTIITAMRAAYRVIEAKLPSYSLLATLADHVNLALPHRYPCSAGHSYLVFDTAGRVSACQMHQHHPITTAHAADPLALVREYQHGIRNLAVEERAGCASCEWRYWCAGGCPLTTYHATGRYDQPSPSCAIYKALSPEVVRLEQLRTRQPTEQPARATPIGAS